MELATLPHHSSAMSTADVNEQHEQPASSAAADVSDTARQRRADQSGGARRSNKKPHKSASDSRVSTLQAESANAQRNQRDSDYQILKYGASHVIHLFVPVSLCMAVVILTIKSVGFYSEKSGNYLPYTPFHSDTDDTGIIFAQSIGNALVMLCVVVVMTVLLILLYYYRFYKVIHGWLILTTLVLLTAFTYNYIYELFKNYNIPLDYPSLAFFIWNWCLVGMICIHWKGPLLLQQFYLIAVSALMALTFIKYLPDWTVWTVLAILSIWDLVAVLCPKGPLRILVETAQSRNEPIFPALIYSSGVLYAYIIYGVMAVTGMGDGDDPNQQQHRQQQQQNQPEEQGSASSTDGLLGNANGTDELVVVAETTVVATAKGAATETTASTSAQAPVITRVAPQRRGRSAGTSADSNNTLVTTLTASGGSRTRTVSHSQQRQQRGGDRSSSRRGGGERRSRSPRHPASEHGVPSSSATGARRGGGDTDSVMVEERGVKLGLGDFIFYSVLVGKASSYGDWNVTIACYVSILVGLAFTLMLLALLRKALPALPISIFAGITFFFATRCLITPFMNEVSVRQIIL